MHLKTVAFGLCLMPTLAFCEVKYTLIPEPENGSVRVTATIDRPNPTESFHIPAWCPGFYFLLSYQDKISDFKAVDPAGNFLAVDHAKEKRTWTVSDPQRKPMTISYRVLGDDAGLGFFATKVLPHTVFVNGPSAFVYADGRLTEPTRLTIQNPKDWAIATSMNTDNKGGFVASGYDELIDHPIQLGHFERRTFVAEGVPFEVVFVSRDQQYRADLDAETERLRKISIPALKLFGKSSFKRYIYFLHLNNGGNFGFAGGLEHRASNVQAILNSRPLFIDDLAAHEYFHAWNVKQIRPKVLGPFDYTQEVRTANLWFAEGVTDYYAMLTTYRSGLHDQAWLLGQYQNSIRELQAGKMRKEVTLADASRRAWENGGFGVGDLSYYTKGQLVGLIFDACIRSATEGKKSLDDVLRGLYSRHEIPKPGYEEDEILKTFKEVSGLDYTALYDRCVNSTQELPYELLEKIGLKVVDSDDPRRIALIADPDATPEEAALREGWLRRPDGVGK